MKIFKFAFISLFFVFLTMPSMAFASTDCCANPSNCTETCRSKGDGWSCIDFSDTSKKKENYYTESCLCQGSALRICAKLKTGSNNAAAGGIMPGTQAQLETGSYGLNDLLQLAVNISKWILSITGSVALLFFIYGGFTMLISGGASDKVQKGKNIIIAASIGLVIVFSSYLIINWVMKGMGYSWNNGQWYTTATK